MDDLHSGARLSPTLVARVKNILLQPKEEWARIDLERTPIATIYRQYVLILAAIGPVCGLIGSLVFGYGVFGIVYRPTVASAVSSAVVHYVLALVMVYVLALIIDGLAPTFAGVRSREQAFKVAAYSSTASWVAGVFGLIPQLSILAALAGLYSLYLLYLGLPRLMRVAQERAVAYVACVIVAAIVLFIIIGAVTAAVTSTFLSFPRASVVGSTTGTLAVPGVGAIDLGKLEAASKQMAAAGTAMQAQASTAGTVTGSAPIVAIAPAALQAFLPASLSGLPRTALSSSSAGAAGVNGATAEAQYGDGAKHIKLSVTDMGALGALAGLGSAFNVESSTQDANGYEKVGKLGDRMTTEKWNAASKSGSYSMLVANRFMVAAEGEGADIDAVKSAVAGVDAAALERLVH